MDNLAARLDSFVLAKMAATRLPAVSLAVIKDGDVIYRRGYGMRNWHDGIAATPATLYGIGSVTKSFTCLAIMQLQEQGLLSIDDPICKYLDFPHRPGGEEVRIWHFMSHTSGIPALAFAEHVLRQAVHPRPSLLSVGSPEDMLGFMDQAGDWAHAKPGERWFYLNEGYVLLGAIIAKVSGIGYEEYIARYVTRPLGMDRTFFSRKDVEADPDVAVPSFFDREDNYHAADYCYGKITAEGGLISSVEDMAKYIQMYLAGGVNHAGERIIGAASLLEMQQPRIATPPEYYPPLSGEPAGEAADRHPSWYGYGLRVAPMGQHRVVGHGGSVYVATAEMAFVPEEQLGVMVLANASGYPCSQTAQYALTTALGQDPEELPFVVAERRLEELEGTYETYKGTVTVSVKRSGSFLTAETQDPHSAVSTVLVPERLGADGALFWTLSGVNRLPVEFIRSGDRIEMIQERYKLRRTGR